MYIASKHHVMLITGENLHKMKGKNAQIQEEEFDIYTSEM
jgi:hypothetical protein